MKEKLKKDIFFYERVKLEAEEKINDLQIKLKNIESEELKKEISGPEYLRRIDEMNERRNDR